MFQFTFDASAGILQVKVEGSWTLSEVERYGREAGVQFAQARKRAGHLRLLIDISGADILSQALMDPLAKAGMQYSRADDRVALIVASTLMKMQMKRMLGEAPVPIFLSREEAVASVLSSDGAASAA